MSDTDRRPDSVDAAGRAVEARGLAPRRPVPAADPPALDTCHGGVVLRAVLLVHGAVAVGAAFASTGFEAWLARAALASAVAFPALLLWLVAVCGLKDLLARLPAPASTALAVVLGAASAAGCWALQAGWGLGLVVDAPTLAAGRWAAPALAGASLAALLVGWLHLRATARAPADTSARLAELQARIRPHFLFNTLNTAIALARTDPARTEELLEDLAELFRVALAGEDAAATLADEVDLARRYLAIEQVRFGQRLRVAWEIDPAAGTARLPVLLLQPLVENAVRHGVEPGTEGGEVRVATRARGGQATVTIVNTLPRGDGDGSVRRGAGMALANVRERLLLMHDVAAEFDAGATGGEWRVRIVVPLA